MSRPSLHHNIEIGGGGEAARVHEISPIEYFVHLPSHVMLEKLVFHFLFDESSRHVLRRSAKCNRSLMTRMATITGPEQNARRLGYTFGLLVALSNARRALPTASKPSRFASKCRRGNIKRHGNGQNALDHAASGDPTTQMAFLGMSTAKTDVH